MCDGGGQNTHHHRPASFKPVRAVRLSLAGWLADYLLTNNTTTTTTHRPSPLPPSPRHIPPPSPVCHSRKTRRQIHQQTHRHPFFLRPAAATACLPAATHSIATHLAAHATQYLQEPERGSTSPSECPPSHPPRVWWASCLSLTLPFRLSRLRGSTRRLTACGPKSLDLLDKCTFAATSQSAIKAMFGSDYLPPSDGCL